MEQISNAMARLRSMQANIHAALSDPAARVAARSWFDRFIEMMDGARAHRDALSDRERAQLHLAFIEAAKDLRKEGDDDAAIWGA